MKSLTLLAIAALTLTGCASTSQNQYSGTWCQKSPKGREVILVTEDQKFIMLYGGGTITKQEHRNDGSYDITIKDISNKNSKEVTVNLKIIESEKIIMTPVNISEDSKSNHEFLFKKPTP